jgi:hypothetical protein
VRIALRPATISPLAPVTEALAAMGRRYPVTGLLPDLVVEDDACWTPASALLDPADGALDELIVAAQRRWDTTPHVAAALAWKAYAYWVALPGVLGYAAAGRLPALDADSVLIRYNDRSPFLGVGLRTPAVTILPTDTLAAAPKPGVRVVADAAALRAELSATLFDGHLGPLADRLHERVHLGRRTLMGSLAAGVGHALSRLAESLPVAAVETATDLLSALDIADLVDLTEQPDGRITIARRTCCLAFALPEPRVCAGCCIRRD